MQNLEDWLADNEPHVLEELNPGASEEALTKLAVIAGSILPADFLDFYRLHDGQRADVGGVINGEELLSVERIIDELTVWTDLLNEGTFDNWRVDAGPEVRAVWYTPRWLPFTYDGAGNHYCLDLDPTESGTYGQIIRMWHDDPSRNVVAASFTTLLTDEDIEWGAQWHGQP